MRATHEASGVMTPREIENELDRYVIGQAQAKRAVAIALRNRWRRMQLEPEVRQEVVPKNILMIGPTGVGKTEIARRLSHLVQAPFIKVEATKFTEVGYVGRDVESIIRDLADVAVKMARVEAMKAVNTKAEALAEALIIAELVSQDIDAERCAESDQDKETYYQTAFRAGKFDDVEIEMALPIGQVGVEIMAPPGMEEMSSQLQNMFQNLNQDKEKALSDGQEAFRVLTEDESAKLIHEEEVVDSALKRVEEHGMVFLDEIDKLVHPGRAHGGEVSREGVQRDLLPLIEGTSVSTKYGVVKTDHILFIASGAFMGVKPSDMASELQGRLPIRVELKALDVEDMTRILIEPKHALTHQYTALLQVEGVRLSLPKRASSVLLRWRIVSMSVP